jgi:hypothetical protein
MINRMDTIGETVEEGMIRVLQAELEATNREVLALTLELEDRVEERTAELRAAQANTTATF